MQMCPIFSQIVTIECEVVKYAIYQSLRRPNGIKLSPIGEWSNMHVAQAMCVLNQPR